MPNISQSESNQTMKFGQVIEEIFFFKIYAEYEGGKLVIDLILFFKNALYQVKASGQQLSFNVFRQPLQLVIQLKQPL